jgi:uncharacterized linocin/CFP29 family protein
MADSNLQLQWTDDQWNKVRQVVYEEARKARVAGNFLPLYGPLEPDATYVSDEVIAEPNSAQDPRDNVPGFTVADTSTLKLPTLQVKVYLRGAQVADPELTSALDAFRRAANVVARLEDEIVFNGQEKENAGPKNMGQTRTPQKRSWEVRGGQTSKGLLSIPVPQASRGFKDASTLAAIGERLVTEISKAIGELESRYHLGPFACVLGHEYFQAVQTPNRSLVLPQDRILPFLSGGALVRSSALPDDTGLVIALGGAPIDLVVATDISVGFLQVTVDPWFVFRVYEKIVLRLKQPQAVEALPPSIGP